MCLRLFIGQLACLDVGQFCFAHAWTFCFLCVSGPVEHSLLGFQLCSFGDGASLRTFGNSVAHLLCSNIASHVHWLCFILGQHAFMAAFVADRVSAFTFAVFGYMCVFV